MLRRWGQVGCRVQALVVFPTDLVGDVVKRLLVRLDKFLLVLSAMKLF